LRLLTGKRRDRSIALEVEASLGRRDQSHCFIGGRVLMGSRKLRAKFFIGGKVFMGRGELRAIAHEIRDF
jgi:hypothetical protein